MSDFNVRPWFVVVAALTTACSGGSTVPVSSGASSPSLTVPAGPLVFRASPTDQPAIRWITPLGNLNPPDHTLPTDHIYFYFAARADADRDADPGRVRPARDRRGGIHRGLALLHSLTPPNTMIKTTLRILLALFFVGAGVNHFLRTGFYLRMMPPYIPFHLEMVQISGVAEIVLGVLLLVPGWSAAAAWGLIALLVAVFPPTSRWRCIRRPSASSRRGRCGCACRCRAC